MDSMNSRLTIRATRWLDACRTSTDFEIRSREPNSSQGYSEGNAREGWWRRWSVSKSSSGFSLCLPGAIQGTEGQVPVGFGTSWLRLPPFWAQQKEGPARCCLCNSVVNGTESAPATWGSMHAEITAAKIKTNISPYPRGLGVGRMASLSSLEFFPKKGLETTGQSRGKCYKCLLLQV